MADQSYSTPLANVFSVFNKGLDLGEQSLTAPSRSSVPPASAPPASAPPPSSSAGSAMNPSPSPQTDPSADLDTVSLVRVLAQLAAAPDGQLPFAYFSEQIPSDAISTLAMTTRLVQAGWIEILSPTNERADLGVMQNTVRLTDQGRQVLSAIGSAATT